MSTRKQRATNRANAQKSTGPGATGATQAPPASRYNPAKHGIFAVHQIMFDESADDLTNLAAEYHEHHSPADPDQRFLVDTLIANEWRLRRMRRVEAELWEHATTAFLAANTQVPACSSGDAFATDSPTFERLQRIVNSCERINHRALKELQRLKVGQAPSLPNVLPNVPANPSPEAEPAPAPAAPPEPTSAEMGSVRQNSKNPPPAAPQPAPAPPFAGPDVPADPAPTPPSASDRDPKPPEAA